MPAEQESEGPRPFSYYVRRVLGMSTDEHHHKDGFGGQDIGWVGSLCLVTNNVVRAWARRLGQAPAGCPLFPSPT